MVISEFIGEDAIYHNIVDHVGASLAIRSVINFFCKNKSEIYNKNQHISISRLLCIIAKGCEELKLDFVWSRPSDVK